MRENKEPVILTLKNLKWMYRGEGNANLVISLPEKKVIIRMQKCVYDVSINKDLLEAKLVKDVQFHKNIMAPLLGRTFVHAPVLARISENEIAEINNCLYVIRPKFRLNKGVRCSLVTCHPDYTRLSPNLSYDFGLSLPFLNENSTYCFEIKPKQGWTHPADRQQTKCAFCGHQYLKFMKKRILKLSKYCPLDLFSGDVNRMKKALKNLLATPQNNLKIFKNGDVIYSEDCTNDFVDTLREFLRSTELNPEAILETWSSIMQEALTKPLTEDSPLPTIVDDAVGSDTSSSYTGCDWNYVALPKNCVLHRILTVQKLQKTNFNSVYKAYREKCEFEGDYDYVNRLLTSFNDLDPIQRYLLSVTAKDCSIFLSFQLCQDKIDNSYHYVTFDRVHYRLNIGISDIDPKPLSCLEKHYRRDKDVLSAIRFLENSKIIV